MQLPMRSAESLPVALSRLPQACRCRPSRTQRQLQGRNPLIALAPFSGRQRTRLALVVAASPAEAKALRAEIDELQEERELALRTAQLNSGKTKKLAKEVHELHQAALRAVQDNKEGLARQLLEEKMALSSELSTAEARSSSNFVLASKLAHVIGNKQTQLSGSSPSPAAPTSSPPEPPYLSGTPGSRPQQTPGRDPMDDVSRDPWLQPWPFTSSSSPASTSSPSSSTTGSMDQEKQLNSRFVELERQELERLMKASSAPRDSSGARNVDVSWEKSSSSSSSQGTSPTSSRPPASPDRGSSAGTSNSSRPSTSNDSRATPERKQYFVSSSSESKGGSPGWWQTGHKLHQQLTGRSTDHEPVQPSDGGSSAAHQAEMILQLILEQQRDNAPLQGTDLVALAGRSLRARLAGREIPSVASTPIDIRRKVLRAAVNVCLHCLETGKSVLPTSGWASGLSSIVEDHHPQLFIVSVAAALDLEAQDAAAALEEALVSLCKAALADALPGANRGIASSDAGQASIQRLQQLNAALKPFVDGDLVMKFSRIYQELFKDTSERDRLWLLLAFKSVADKDAAALVAVAEALGVSY